jgi:hypothetical protein
MPQQILFISGLPRCATTAFVSLLSQHPQVSEPAQKEPHFFLPKRLRETGYALESGGHKLPFSRLGFCLTESQYFRNFRLREDAKFCIDGSTLYSVHDGSFSEIARHTGIEPYFLLLTRDPLKRAISHYLFSQSRGEEHRLFQNALDEERSEGSTDWILGGYFRGSQLRPAVDEITREFGRDRLCVVDIDKSALFLQPTMDNLTHTLGLPAYSFDFDVYSNAVPQFSSPRAARLRILARQIRQINPSLLDNRMTRSLFESSIRRLASPLPQTQRNVTLSDAWQSRFEAVRKENERIMDEQGLALPLSLKERDAAIDPNQLTLHYKL